MQEGGEEQCHVQKRWLCGHRRPERSYSTFQVRRGDLVQGKEQRLRFARSSCEEIPHVQGKRNPSKTVGVARGYQRADILKP